jgi:hypothetical protein
MIQQIDARVVSKYRKVCRLWESTEGPEKAAAARIMGSLQNAYPGIQYAASTVGPADGGPLPSWKEAMSDALELLAGMRAPSELLEKYLSLIEQIENGREEEKDPRPRGRPRLRDFVALTLRESAAGARIAIEVNQRGTAFFERGISGGASEKEIEEVADEIGRMARGMFLTYLRSLK